ncbi:PadR family transcriptional regulator [bacterium]|nr:MAG: PadR family transcriptional regulator [bacterium]
MNAIGYTLLGVLARGSFTGYDMMRKIESLRSAKHSQIYPLLSKMEKEGLVEFEHVSQTCKPDKKIYSITDKGLKALEEWVLIPPTEAVIRDEMTMKVFSMWLTDRDKAKSLFIQRIDSYNEKLNRYKRKILKLQTNNPEIDIMNPEFIHIMLLQRAIKQTEQEISWCESMIQKFEKESAVKKNDKSNSVK